VEISLFPDRSPCCTAAQLLTSIAPTLGGATLKLIATTNFTPNQTFTIVQNSGTAPVTNTFKNLPEGAVLAATNGNLALRISYVGGTGGNDVVLTALNNTPPTFAA